MSVRSGFFNSVGGDRVYSASEFAEYFAAFIGNGVFPEPLTSLQIQADTGMNLKVKAGKAWINGFFIVNDSDYTEAITADAVLNRIDRYVVRLHFANRTMSIVRKAGTAASSPVAPAVTRDAEMYELSLALIQVNAAITSITSGMITDTRTDTDVCGYVASTITNLPYQTPNRVLVSDSSGALSVSEITTTKIGYLSDVTSNIGAQLNAKQSTITGAASTVVASNLTAARVVITDANGKIAASASVNTTELSYLIGASSNIQTQLNAKQATITGGASTIVSSNLATNKALVSDADGKVAASAVTASEIGFLAGVTSGIQSQIDGKLGSTAQAADSLKVGGKKITVGTSAPASPAVGDVWIDTN